MKNFRCNDCGKWIGNFSNLKRHYQRFHESRESFCDACGKLFRKLNLYQEHMAMHKKSQVYQCETCEKKFNSQSKLHKHTQYHLPKDYVICRKKECYQKFDNLETLKEHEKNNHPPKGKLDYFWIKFKLLPFINFIINHPSLLIIDKNLKEFKCAFETCGKIFNKKFNLQQHINSKHIHIKVKCDHCGKRLSTKPALIKHIKVFHSCTPRPPIKKPLVRKPRKDKGIPKRSELSKLCGFNLLPTIEKDVIDRSETVLTSLNEIQESDNIHFWKVSVDKAFNENLVDEELQGNEEADTI